MKSKKTRGLQEWLWLGTIGLALVLAGCTPLQGGHKEGAATSAILRTGAPAVAERTENPARVTVSGTLVSFETGASKELLLAAEQLYLVKTEAVPVTVEGRQAVLADLKSGMQIRVTFDGCVEEIYPARLGQVYAIEAHAAAEIGQRRDLCGLYLKVLEDLWQEDAGLNGGVVNLSVDLEKAPGDLTETEKAAIAWLFAGRHHAVPLSLSYDELIKEGYIKPEQGWQDGLLFTISRAEDQTKENFTFNALKYRGPLGAIFWDDCTVDWNEDGSWQGYEVGSFAIS